MSVNSYIQFDHSHGRTPLATCAVLFHQYSIHTWRRPDGAHSRDARCHKRTLERGELAQTPARATLGTYFSDCTVARPKHPAVVVQSSLTPRTSFPNTCILALRLGRRELPHPVGRRINAACVASRSSAARFLTVQRLLLHDVLRVGLVARGTARRGPGAAPERSLLRRLARVSGLRLHEEPLTRAD